MIESSHNGWTWMEVGKVAANVKTFTDTSSSSVNANYYRVTATNESNGGGP